MMHSFTVFSTLAVASLILAKPLATPAVAPLITAAPLPHMVKPALERRQTESLDECEAKARSFWDDAPDIEYFGDPLALWWQTLGERVHTATLYNDAVWTISELCSITYLATSEIPESLTSAYASLMSASASWVSEFGPTVTSVAQSCGGAGRGALSAGLEVLLATNFDECTSAYGVYMSEALALAASVSSASHAATASPTATPRPAQTGSTSVRPIETASSSSSQAANTTPSSSQSTGGAPRETGFAVAAAAAVVVVAGGMVAL
ncbi:hypothetical protein N657DRAFT_367387 [Parathielavia appendiculata]|uniref:Uncharacterized protein n=1 Tax=Parathielavia appendiculata TaxID=2587402 RepID=A0AAN6TQC2_9PEZI|nr:hypothetical protein N657DRAFT_367387 [Parathielavia appendiculata]